MHCCISLSPRNPAPPRVPCTLLTRRTAMAMHAKLAFLAPEWYVGSTWPGTGSQPRRICGMKELTADKHNPRTETKVRRRVDIRHPILLPFHHHPHPINPVYGLARLNRSSGHRPNLWNKLDAQVIEVRFQCVMQHVS